MASTNQFDVITYIMAKKYADRVGMYINPSHNFADDTARNVYFAANETEVVLGMFIIQAGALLKLLETDYSDNDSWQDISPIIKGDKGDTGVGGEGVAPGGTAGQVLAKATEADYDTEWVTPAAADVTYNNAVSGLTADDVQDAIDEHTTNTTTAHGAVSTATASKIIIRDSNGRAKIADPSASDDIASKGYVDGLPLHGFRNKIINGNFDIWQRGVSFTATGYTADRWRLALGTSAAVTLTREAFALAGLTGEPQYSLKLNRTTTGDTATTLDQRIEGVRTLANKTVTVSFYAKASADFDLDAAMVQFFGTTGSPSADVSTSLGSFSLTTSWQRFTKTVDIPSITGKTLGDVIDNCLILRYSMATAASTKSFELSQVQVEEGAVATPFEQRPIGLELSLCQRYYYRISASASAPWTIFSVGFIPSAAIIVCNVTFPVSMRIIPTLVTTGTANNYAIYENGGNSYVLSTVPSLTAIGSSLEQCQVEGVSSGMTAARAGMLRANDSSTAFLGFDAEL